MMGVKGKAVILLQKWPDGSKHVQVRIQSFGGWSRFDDDCERIEEWLEGDETWHAAFEHLAAAQWVRYYVKFTQTWRNGGVLRHCGNELVDDFDAEIVRTLKRGRLYEHYIEKRLQDLAKLKDQRR